MITSLTTILLSLLLLYVMWKITVPLIGFLSHPTKHDLDGAELPGNLQEEHSRYVPGNYASFMQRFSQLLIETRVIGPNCVGLDILGQHPDKAAAYDAWSKSRPEDRRFLPAKDNPPFTYKGASSVSELATYPAPSVTHLSFVNGLPVLWNYKPKGHGNMIQTIETLWLFRSGKTVKGILERKLWVPNTVYEAREPSSEVTEIGYQSLYAAGPKLKVSNGTHSCKDIKHLIMEEGVMETFHSIIEGFGSSKKLYKTLGIPYKLGVLLQGLPGTGKTSLLKALAAYYNTPLVFINMSTMTDELFTEAVDRIKGVCGIIVMEDLDATGVQTNREDSKERNGVKLSQLLNFLDGVDTPESSIIIITTNHPEKFDPALVRPGRIDHVIDMHGLPPDRAILVLQNTLEAAELDKHMLDDKFQELFGNEERVQPAAVQQFAQKEIFGYTYQQQNTPKNDSE